jgi:hypothetical protein
VEEAKLDSGSQGIFGGVQVCSIADGRLGIYIKFRCRGAKERKRGCFAICNAKPISCELAKRFRCPAIVYEMLPILAGLHHILLITSAIRIPAQPTDRSWAYFWHQKITVFKAPNFASEGAI